MQRSASFVGYKRYYGQRRFYVVRLCVLHFYAQIITESVSNWLWLNTILNEMSSFNNETPPPFTDPSLILFPKQDKCVCINTSLAVYHFNAYGTEFRQLCTELIIYIYFTRKIMMICVKTCLQTHHDHPGFLNNIFRRTFTTIHSHNIRLGQINCIWNICYVKLGALSSPIVNHFIRALICLVPRRNCPKCRSDVIKPSFFVLCV